MTTEQRQEKRKEQEAELLALLLLCISAPGVIDATFNALKHTIKKDGRYWYKAGAQQDIDEVKLDEFANAQFQYLLNFKSDVSELTNNLTKPTHEDLDALTRRINAYVKSCEALYWRGLVNSPENKNKYIKWHEGGTTDKCDTCLTMQGRGWLSVEEFIALGIYPQTAQLECGGFHCLCSLEAANKDDTMGLNNEMVNVDLSNLADEFLTTDDVLTISGEFELVGDATVSRKVRQVYTVANRKNKNRRILPLDELQRAIDDFRPRAQAGAALGEYKHPMHAKAQDGIEYFIDNEFRKAIRIENISDPDVNGKVWGTHTCLATPLGDAILKLYNDGIDTPGAEAPGISMRYRCKQIPQRIGGEDVIVCRNIVISTFDSVTKPAFVESLKDYQLLTDSENEEINKNLGENYKMTAQITKALARYKKSILGADLEAIKVAREYANQLIGDSLDLGEEVGDAVEQFKAIEKLSPTEDSTFVKVAELGSPGFASDVKALADPPEVSGEKVPGEEVAKDAEIEALKEDVKNLQIKNEKIAADAELAAKGLDMTHYTGAIGQSVSNAAIKHEDETHGDAAYKVVLEKLMTAVDEYAAKKHRVDTTSSLAKSIRKNNREKFINPLVESLMHSPKTYSNALTVAFDSENDKTVDEIEQDIKSAYIDTFTHVAATADDANLGAIGQQPTISLAILMQMYQDLSWLSFVEGIGAGASSNGNDGWFPLGPGLRDNGDGTGTVGAVLRIAVEQFSPNSADLAVAEGGVMAEYNQTITWQPYAPSWKRALTSITADVQAVSEQGPLNYDVIARAIFHLGYLLSRTIDGMICDEVLKASDEVAPVAVSNETVNNTYNSVYAAGGSVTVNLNPTKAASAAVVASTDASVSYGPTVIAAVRAQEAGNGSTSPYFGGTLCAVPIVRPRTVQDLTAAGAYTTTVNNPITLTTPGSGVQGYYDIVSKTVISAPGTVATYAVDYDNAVILFVSGVTGSGGILSTSVEISYSYATNLYFYQVNNVTYGTGITQTEYLSGIFYELDKIAADMTSEPRFAKPNLAIMHVKASPNFTAASIFYKLMSPEGTNLFPTEQYFFERTGIMGARVNTPRFPANRVIIGRHGATKYAVSVNEIKGPFQKRDSSGNLLDVTQYFCHQLSTICTPQLQTQPLYTSLILY